MKKLVELMRVNQWYKNLLIFLPLVFGHQLLSIVSLEKTVIGLASLCLASSSGYIFNDLIDRKRDVYHPESAKKHIATGKVGVMPAFVFAVMLILLSFASASSLSAEFSYFILAIFCLTQLYSLWLKNEIFADIIMISINFVLRAVSGAYVISASGKPYIWISPWLLVCTFLLALFVAAGKRSSELMLIKKNPGKYRQSLMKYTPETVSSLLAISSSSLIIAYILYTFQSVNQMLIFTAPFGVYVVLRYLYLINSGSRIPLSPGRFYKDSRLTFGAVLWAVSVFAVIYLI